MLSHRCLLAVVAAVALCCLVCPCSARSGGALSSCDLTPVVYPKPTDRWPGPDGRKAQIWPNGLFGTNWTNQVAYNNEAGVMNWVRAPEPTAFYTIRAGDAALSQDRKEYIPGGTLNEIHLRVQDFAKRYIGIVLYATTWMGGVPPNKTREAVVGSWALPDTEWFQLPVTCGGNVITHQGAQEKPLHTRFYFAAPVGTGSVRFRVLIKWDVQGRGQFYYPAQELMLREGAAPAVQPPAMNSTAADGSRRKYERSGAIAIRTVVGVAGRACADVCAVQALAHPFCDAKATQSIGSEAAFLAAQANVPCRAPVLAGCPFYTGGAQVDSDNFCYYRSSDVKLSCPSALRSFPLDAPLNASVHAADPCFTAPSASRRAVCVCSNAIEAQPDNPFYALKLAAVKAAKAANNGKQAKAITEGEASAAGKTATPLLALMMAGVVFATGAGVRSRVLLAALAAVALLSLASPVAAHNWINSLHRATTASTTSPCPARIGNQPHAQLIAGQEFPIEWVSGHPDNQKSPFYFAMVPTAFLAQLGAGNISAIFEDYLAAAPSSAIIPTGAGSDGRWDPYFIYQQSEVNPNEKRADYNHSFDKYFTDCPNNWVKPGNSRYIERPAAYRERISPSFLKDESDIKNPIKQCSQHAQHLAWAKRAQYRSDKYPWLEGVHRFGNPYAEAFIYGGQSSISRFTVPGYHKEGDYVAFFFWQGYRDCMDINLVAGTQAVANPFGKPGGGLVWARVDHCEFRYQDRAMTTLMRVNDGNITECLKRTAKGRWGDPQRNVQVVRGINPPQVKLNVAPNIPWTQLGSGKCGFYTVEERMRNGCTDLYGPGKQYNYDSFANPANYAPITADDVFCYAPDAAFALFDAVSEYYRTTTDPADAAYYSTCYFNIPAGGFIGIPEDSYTRSDWKTAEATVDCEVQQSLLHVQPATATDWSKAMQSSYAGRSAHCGDLEASAQVEISVQQLLQQHRGADLSMAGANYAGMSAAAAESEPDDPDAPDSPVLSDCPSDQDCSNSGSNSGSKSKLLLYVVIGGVVGLLLLAAATFFGVRRYRAKSSLLHDLNKLGMHSSSEMTNNPAATQW